MSTPKLSFDLPQKRQGQDGFTLIELLLTCVVFGILSVAFDGYFGQLVAVDRRAYTAQQDLVNRGLSKGLLDYSQSRSGSDRARLPDPYSGSSYLNTVCDLSDATLRGFLTGAGVSVEEINDDGLQAENVRVFQKVSLTANLPFWGQTGPTISMPYDVGVIYMTSCPKVDGLCNTGMPGASSTLTSGNVGTWTTSGTDFKATWLSTLQIQKEMLRQTNSQISIIRQHLMDFFSVKQRAAAYNDTSNFYPAPTGGGAPNLSSASGICEDGWYQLGAANVNVLSLIGLSKSQYGKTPWGGAIEYCRDYDPASDGEGIPPHYSALRISEDVAAGSNPDGTNDIIVSF